MRTRYGSLILAAAAIAAPTPASVAAADPFATVVEKTNPKLVKVFGAGGFSRLNNYGTGIVISPDGHILTAASQLLDTTELVVHLYDGRRMKAQVLVVEPELDTALIKIKVEGKRIDEPTGLDLPYFDFAEAARRPPAQPGDWILGFSNLYEIALRDEPVSVMRGVISAYTKLHGRQGMFEFPYSGDVYIVDAVLNNPGAAGGALTDRQGNLLGIIGREIKNTLSETYVNYAIPVGASVKVQVRVKDKEEERTISLPEFVQLGMQGKYKPVKKDRPPPGIGGFSGINFVPDVLERTPAYVEDVVPGSPAAKAGIKPDDLISFVDGEPVASIKEFQRYIRERTRAGSTIRLEVRRGEGLQTIEMKLDPQPVRIAPPTPPKPPAKMP